MSVRSEVGRYGEDVAARHLTETGLLVLARNWRCREGELDLVMLDGDCVVAVEVKTRRSVRYGTPLEAITPAKAARLRRLLAAWVAQAPVRVAALRIDAVGVVLPARGAPVVEHVRGIA